MRSTIAKNTEGFGYKYTELADINKYCEANKIRYYQEVETSEINQKDYIITYIIRAYVHTDEKGKINYEEVTTKHRGCQIVEARLSGINNPVQAYGSSITYTRRYSLMMALGLAGEDSDAAELTELTEETAGEFAKNYKFSGGKHKDWTLEKVIKEDKSFLKWLVNNSKDQKLLKAIELLTGEVQRTDEEWDEKIKQSLKLQ